MRNSSGLSSRQPQATGRYPLFAQAKIWEMLQRRTDFLARVLDIARFASRPDRTAVRPLVIASSVRHERLPLAPEHSVPSLA